MLGSLNNNTLLGKDVSSFSQSLVQLSFVGRVLAGTKFLNISDIKNVDIMLK